MKNFYPYIRAYKKESILAPLFKMLEALFELFVPLVVANIINEGIANRDIGYVYKMGALLVVLGIIGLSCSAVAQYFAAKSAVGFSTELRKDLFARINRFSYSQIDEMGISTLLTRITNDTNWVQSGINLFLRIFLRSPFIIIGAIIASFYLDKRIALVFVVVIPILTILVLIIMYYTMPLYENVQKKLDLLLGKVRENLIGVRVIRAFNRQDIEASEFKDEADRLLKMQIFVGRISAMLNPLTYLFINFAIILILLIGSKHVEIGIYKTGVVVALVNYMSQILIEVVKLANLLITLTKAMASAKRINEILVIDDFMEGGEEKLSYLGVESIKFSDVSFKYPRNIENSIENITFEAKKGEIIGIIGSTGSGKSTLIQMIPRYYDVDSGKITINGKTINEYDMLQLHNTIRIVAQKASLIKGTIYDNLCMGKKNATKDECVKALSIAQALDIARDGEDILEKELSEGGSNLSGGQKQRLTIARAIVNDPSILLLDDSTSALDSKTEARFVEALRQINNKIIFMVSQKTSSIKGCDRILVLEEGHIVGEGSHNYLLENCDTYKEICKSQSEG